MSNISIEASPIENKFIELTNANKTTNNPNKFAYSYKRCLIIKNDIKRVSENEQGCTIYFEDCGEIKHFQASDSYDAVKSMLSSN